jgi:uracil-DNA glycosylase family 4
MVSVIKMHQLSRFFEKVSLCRNCDACLGASQKVFDRNLILYSDDVEEKKIKVVFVGMSPAYCEDRTGLPLVGWPELYTSRCGICTYLGDCFKYQLHLSDGYKDSDSPCLYNPLFDIPEIVDTEKLQTRLENIGKMMLFQQNSEVVDPRTAGALLDYMLSVTGFIRPTMSCYQSDKKRFGLSQETASPNCAIINAVQCRTCSKDTITGTTENRDPSKEEINYCRPLVKDFIDIVQPELIIALGKVATISTTGIINPEISKIHGESFKSILHDTIPVIPMYHPAYHMRQLHNHTLDKLPDCIEKDIALLERISKGIL